MHQGFAQCASLLAIHAQGNIYRPASKKQWTFFFQENSKLRGVMYESKARVSSEEKLVEMETAIQALEAIQSYCFLDISRGFAEFCKQTLGFQVDD